MKQTTQNSERQYGWEPWIHLQKTADMGTFHGNLTWFLIRKEQLPPAVARYGRIPTPLVSWRCSFELNHSAKRIRARRAHLLHGAFNVCWHNSSRQSSVSMIQERPIHLVAWQSGATSAAIVIRRCVAIWKLLEFNAMNGVPTFPKVNQEELVSGAGLQKCLTNLLS